MRLARKAIRHCSMKEKLLSLAGVRTENPNDIVQYHEGEMVRPSSIVLHQKENIDEYVLKLVKEYFRTTNRAVLQLDSELKDHGIDSLDVIELAMRIEEDLGYKISAENLAAFSKVKHFATFIAQTESFKADYGKNPLS